jgi:hypothetical protein
MNLKYISFSLTTVLLLWAGRAQAQFGATHLIAKNNSINGLTHDIVDIDHDADLDIIVLANAEFSGQGNLLLFLNDGFGHFAQPKTILTNIGSPKIADFNHDDFPDLVFWRDKLIYWSPNNGDGTFSDWVPVLYSSTGVSDSGNPVDMNNDGETDLAFTGWWLENEGMGIFLESHFITNTASGLFHYDGMIDLDGDGLPDWLISEYTGSAGKLYWRKQLPDGSFGPEKILGVQPNVSFYVKAVDLDLDGDLDVIGAELKSNMYLTYDIQWFENLGNGNFGQAISISEAIYAPISYGDINGDGLIDMYGPDAFTNKISWLRNDGGGNFSLLKTTLRDPGGGSKMADISGDGHSDLIIMNSSALFISLGDGTGGFSQAKAIYPDFTTPNDAILADADADGDPDVFFNDADKNEMGWLKNDGQGNFAQKNIVEYGFDSYNLFVGDLNNDGYPELAPVYMDSLQLLWKGAPNGNYGAPDTIVRDLASHYIANVADIDSDGDLDWRIIANYPWPAVYQQGWMYNDGAGNFTPPTGSVELGGTLVDIDSDGLPDEVGAVAWLPAEMFWRKNYGNGNFGPQISMGTHASYKVQSADFDQDGDADFLLAVYISGGPNSQYFGWLENQNMGTNWVERPIEIANVANTNLGDFNNDGTVDICFATQNQSSSFSIYSWIANDGTGHFGNPNFIADKGGISETTPVDLDLDGDLDIMFRGSAGIGWFENFSKDPVINGHCYFDANANGQQDSTETPLAGIKINLEPSGKTTFSDPDGGFRFYSSPGDFLLSAEAGDCFQTSSSPTVFSIHLPLSSSDTIFSFGFKNKTAQSSVTASVTASTTRCGFSVPFWITLQNNGCYPSVAAVSVHYNNLVTFLSADLPALAQGDSILWKSGDALQPGESRSIRALFRVAGAEHLGDSIKLITNAWLSDSLGNLLSTPATTFFASEVNCAYDPNDKMVDRKVLPIEYDPISSELTYTIRFQNTGTDTAFNIRVLDTLSAHLDWKSFRPRGVSHPCTIDLDQTSGALEYRFDNILLSDSTKNEPASHGFVAFSIRLKPDLPPSTGIPNRAAIYFDFNAPIFTNTAETYIERLVSASKEPISAWPITVSPNPNSGVFSVQLPEAAKAGMALRVLGLMGQLLLEQPVQAGTSVQIMQAGALPSGMYFLQVVSGGKVMGVEKFVKE